MSLAIFSSCGALNSVNNDEEPIQSKPEAAYCSTPATFSPSVALTATAQFKPREVVLHTVSVSTERSRLVGETTAKPVRFAEVRIKDPSGNIIQCAETDASGNISTTLPQVAGTYTLEVLSRSDNTRSKVSVLNNPTENSPYIISSTVTVLSNSVSLTATLPQADSSGLVLAGAFNILDQVYRANEFLRNSTCEDIADQSNPMKVCNLFTVAPKIPIFWTPGFNPANYFDSTGPLSFYMRAASGSMKRGLYILGGSDGDYTCVDTDHFDNSIVVHEYGHFLEDTYGSSDSPGGSHNANSQIDPRLAWSEGWSNFFQAAMLDYFNENFWGKSSPQDMYLDTVGNSDCISTTNGLALDLGEMKEFDVMTSFTTLGQGIFRELSVSRVLIDTFKNDNIPSSTTNGVGFPFIWDAFSNSTRGLTQSSLEFRNMGIFNQSLRSLISARRPASLSAFDADLVAQRQVANSSAYALPVVPRSSGFCTNSNATIKPSTSFNRTLAYYFDGSSGRATLSSTTGTFDVYYENYIYGSSSDKVNLNGSSNSVSLSGKPAGWYLLSLNFNTSGLISLGSGEILCP